MNKKTIQTEYAPKAIGAYSQAVQVHNFVFTSGQIPLDPTTGEIVGNTITEQTEQVLKNLLAIINAAGAEVSQVVKTTCFLSNMDDFAGFNEAYSQVFTTNPPARSCVAVKTLPKQVLVEIEAIIAL